MFALPIHVSGTIRIEHVERNEWPLQYTLGPVTEQEGVSEPMAQTVILTDSQDVALSAVVAVDKKGNPVPLASTPTFATTDTTIITVTDNGDGTAKVSAVGALGTGKVMITADALTDEIDVAVQAGAASSLSATIGTPEEQPDATPVPAAPTE